MSGAGEEKSIEALIRRRLEALSETLSDEVASCARQTERRLERSIEEHIDRGIDRCINRIIDRIEGRLEVPSQVEKVVAGRVNELNEVMDIVRRMTPRQQGVLLLIIEGAQGAEVAAALGKNLSTAKSAMATVTHALGETRSADAISRVRGVWDRVDAKIFQQSRGMDLGWGKEALRLVRAGREDEVDRSLFVERRGRIGGGRGNA
jgi:DNA-binding CsgD family transcriptional regulator